MAILDESLPDTVALFDLTSDTPLSWAERRGRVAGVDSIARSACQRASIVPAATRA
jgi:hypothetical protein